MCPMKGHHLPFMLLCMREHFVNSLVVNIEKGRKENVLFLVLNCPEVDLALKETIFFSLRNVE